HYCGYTTTRPSTCPHCGSSEISMVGLGTQRIEDELSRLFPGKTILRIDLDTMRRRTAYLEAWDALSKRKADIIVGTQMIARGIHLEGIGLVVVPLADVSLYQPDFRAAERAFALLTQVAGRAGRGESHGRVIIQTYVPHHYAIRCAENHDYVTFYRQECRIRKILRFPPFSRLIAVLGQAEDFEIGQEIFSTFTEELKNLAYPHREKVNVLGPTPAPIPRISGRFRWRTLIRGEDVKLMHSLTQRALESFRRQRGHSKIELTVDVDPHDLL
ncbi:MAG: primosomal protein N', partial [Candidatus Sumerlaeaceae bacterium]|nr:primosomal protein N' [Candidatus Sumerlaeaceae bacterium]